MNKTRNGQMKKAPLLMTLLIIMFVLTACGSGSGSTNNTSTNGFRAGAGASGPLNPESKLALGTIKLEGTKQAVDPKMAAKLIPLWQLLIQLNSSSSTAPQEVTAVVDQIHTTMTPDQVNAINSMQLTQADIFTVFQQQGQANGTRGTDPNGSTGPSNSTGGNRGNRGNGGGQGFVFVGGGPGGGGFPGGGFRNGTGSSSSTQTNSALSEAQIAQARENAISNVVINQVIRLLETKLKS
jgi:hypothetical protein